MSLKLISRNERYPIETEYISEYEIWVETLRTSLAKTPETRNEMIVTLEVPKSEYRNDINVQTIMKWAEMSVNNPDYFRDLAIHFETDEGLNERSIVFTHAKITLEEYGNVKSDFVEIKLFINQRRDKFTGVMFGINLDDTYERAWYRANNPPTLNIVVPPDINKRNMTISHSAVPQIEYADAPNKVKKGKLIFLTHGFTGEPSRWDYMIDYLKNSGIKLVHLGEIKDGIVTRKNTVIKALNSENNFKSETEEIINSGKHVVFTINIKDLVTIKNRTLDLETISKELFTDITCVCPIEEKLILIGHSLGGLVNMGYAVGIYDSLGNTNLDCIDKIVSFNTPYNGSSLALDLHEILSTNSEAQKKLSKYWNNIFKSKKIKDNLLVAIASVSQPYTIIDYNDTYYNEAFYGVLEGGDEYVKLSSQLGLDKKNYYEGFYRVVFAKQEKDLVGMNLSVDKILYVENSLKHVDITDNDFVLNYFKNLLGL